MEYKVEYGNEQDAPALGRINNDSFQSRLLLPALFPQASQSELWDYKAIHVMKHLANPETHLVKVVDPSSGEVVGYGRWHIPEVLGVRPYIPDLSEQAKIYAKDPVAFAPQPMNQELYTGFRALLNEGRQRNTTDRDMSRWSPQILPLPRSSPETDHTGSSARLTGHVAQPSRARHWICYHPLGYGSGRCVTDSHLP